MYSIAGRYSCVRRSSSVDNLSQRVIVSSLREENVVMLPVSVEMERFAEPSIDVRDMHSMCNFHSAGRLHICNWMEMTKSHFKRK